MERRQVDIRAEGFGHRIPKEGREGSLAFSTVCSCDDNCKVDNKQVANH